MKRRWDKIAFPITVICFLLFSCNFEIPDSVSVKTDAKYNLPLGDSTVLKMSDYVSASKIKDGASDLEFSGSSINVYDYNPGASSSVQHYLIEYKIANYSLDISDYLSNLSAVAEAGFSGESNSKAIDIPSVDLTKSVNATITGGQISSEYANYPISISNFPVTFSATVPLDDIPSIIDSITISDGFFSVDSDKDGVSINITSFSINGTEYEKTGNNLYSLSGLTISASFFKWFWSCCSS